MLPPALPDGPVLLVAPHPDDETIGAGGLLSAAVARGQPVWVVIATSGDAFPWALRERLRYWRDQHAAFLAIGRRRMAEARQATARLGVPPARLIFLGFPDRGLEDLLAGPPDAVYRSRETGRSSVPYPEAHRPGAPYTSAELAAQLGELIDQILPATVLTPAPLDSHADHRALTQLTRQVCAARPAVRLLYYPVQSDLFWPSPKGYWPGLPLRPPDRAAHPPGRAWRPVPLSKPEVGRKRAALGAYQSQLRVMGPLLWAYVRRNELLRDADPLPAAPRLIDPAPADSAAT